MKKITTLLMALTIASNIHAQLTDPDDYHRLQIGPGTNWWFDNDTIRINRLHIDNKFGIDSTGNIFYYDNATPAAGMLLKGDGTYYQNFSKGSAGQFLRVNSGGTDLEWNTFDGGDITGLPDNFVLFGSSTGGIDYSSDLQYDGTTFSCQGTGYFDQGLTIGGTGGFSTIFDSQGLISDYYGAVDAGDIFYGVTGGGLMMRLPLGTANQVLQVKSDGTNLEWFTPTFLTAEVDGSTTNEVQNLSYDASNHEVDISLSGTSAVLPLAVDDGATEGLASFTAADFNSSAGNISIDYTNGQAATSGAKGFLTSTDWTTFNNKVGLVQAPTEQAGQTASIGATTVYTTPAADAYYRVTVTATVTTAAGSTMDLGVQLRFTEATDNVVKTFPNGNVNGYNRTTTNTTAATVSVSAVCHVKANTNIQYITSWSPTGGSPQYNVHVTIEKIY